jgi:hypothetical protein
MRLRQKISMNETLAEFISRRRKEIDDEAAPLRTRLLELEMERRQIDQAALVTGISRSSDSMDVKKRGPRPKEGTIKDAVVKILMAAGEGLMAYDILSRLNEINGSTLVRASLSPQLSRLKQAGILDLTDGYWHLPGKPPQKENAPDQNLFEEKRSEGADRDPEAKGGKASPGGGA